MSLTPPPHAPYFPAIVTLCGSTRFYDEFQQANYELTMAGYIVLSVGFYPHAKVEHGHGEGVGHDSEEKVRLDELHLRKIDLADWVYVIDPGGYIGDSTRREVLYALAKRKLVKFMEPPTVPIELPAPVQQPRLLDAIAEAFGMDVLVELLAKRLERLPVPVGRFLERLGRGPR